MSLRWVEIAPRLWVADELEIRTACQVGTPAASRWSFGTVASNPQG